MNHFVRMSLWNFTFIRTEARSSVAIKIMNESILRKIKATEIPSVDADPVDPAALIDAQKILNDVKHEGEKGLLKYALKYGDIAHESAKYVLSKEEMKAAFDRLCEKEKKLLERTQKRIEYFAKAQKNSLKTAEVNIPGGRAGHSLSAVSVAGCYAPGGRYPLPSSVLMTAVTARVAGVKTVIVSSPRPVPITIAAAHVADADYFLCVGGAQGIAAMAYGVGVPSCDIIVGPGNKWVTAAKSLVQGFCAIDMLAGPSEVLVIADSSADPDVVAADLLAQAEHDVDARPILVATDDKLADDVDRCLKERLKKLSTSETAAEACKKGFVVICKDINEAIEISDRIAPEHLEIQTQNAEANAKRCQNYGSLFIGSMAAEVLGDYGAGPNHVLPTGGTSRYTGGLSVFNFIRIRTWMCIDNLNEAQPIVEDSVQFALLEGLEGHSQSAQCRLLK